MSLPQLKDLIYLIAPTIAWVSSQIIKYILFLRKNGLQMRDLFQSGGLPSAHVAFFSALTATIGLNDGFYSPVFALSICVTSVVLYDAMSVRMATGQQTRALMVLYKKLDTKMPKIANAEGHTLIEVISGLLVGVIVAVVLTKTL